MKGKGKDALQDKTGLASWLLRIREKDTVYELDVIVAVEYPFSYDAVLPPTRLMSELRFLQAQHIVLPGGSCRTSKGAYCGNGTENESLIHLRPVTSTLVVCTQSD
jgi:hypothetical protein